MWYNDASLYKVLGRMGTHRVEDHICSRSSSPPSWTMRLKVAQDAARGLTYLHEDIFFSDYI
ncbi:putative non-specific serine/threonine protein kinase [Helianthus debilis subsp. tardiflorus]